MTLRFRPLRAPTLLFTLGVFLPGYVLAQEKVLEKPIQAEPIPPADPEAYEPCFWTNRGGTAMCLTDREARVRRLKEGEFEGEGWSCGLLFPGEETSEQFACGDLLIGLRKDREEEALDEILRASSGEWDRIEARAHVQWDYGKLKVRRGTERNAFLNIIFHPTIMWVQFNYNRGVISSRREAGFCSPFLCNARFPLRPQSALPRRHP